VLCIVLLLLGAAVQSTHMHQDGMTHSDCALCVTVHTAVSVAGFLAFFLLLEVVTTPAACRREIFEHREVPFALSNRPPPVDLA
jgi:hypothetical protein